MSPVFFGLEKTSLEQPRRRSGLATLPSVGAIPYSPDISVD